MNTKAVVVYAKSGSYLVPVKVYKYFGWAIRFVRENPEADLTVRLRVWGNEFQWWKFCWVDGFLVWNHVSEDSLPERLN